MCFEIGGNQVHQQQLVNLLLVVDAVLLHQAFRFALEHRGYLKRKFRDAQCSVLFVRLLALAALLLRFRRLF
ncbi:hypothetical protein JYG35_06540 [Pseudomonas rhodesiae]|uniref:hypothetical protein n=1 Tax=Pseudomonas rhodesiae TaxID=76760 RepID=UPI001BCAF16C|nr:hypothetical protein JYG35_06540 [Pseudomonas rhodesiae]